MYSVVKVERYLNTLCSFRCNLHYELLDAVPSDSIEDRQLCSQFIVRSDGGGGGGRRWKRRMRDLLIHVEPLGQQLPISSKTNHEVQSRNNPAIRGKVEREIRN